MENRYKFNAATELNSDFDINLYETKCRLYDPQLGRFWQVDELAEANWEWTPYNFALNNPVSFNDPLGLIDEPPRETSTPENPKTLSTVVITTGTPKMTQAQIQQLYVRMQKAGIGTDRVSSWQVRDRLERYGQVSAYMEKVHAGIKEDGLMLLEGASWFIPAGQLAKLRYLKYALNLFKIKRGGIVVKVASNFATELGKNILAKNGNLGNVDWNDVIVNTATANFNILGKIIAKTWNSATDISYSEGNVSLLNDRKTFTSAGIDLLFNYVKLGAKSLAEPGQSKDAVNVFEILMDQSKNGMKDVIK
jgi:RHS repeat-associated protein